MSDPKSEGSESRSKADVSESQSTEAFSLLGNETRLAILLALWELEQPDPDTSDSPIERQTVTFSQLRDLVGISDSGQFNYHLGQLEDEFIKSTDDGYSLSTAGYQIVRTLIANSGFDDVSLQPSEIDIACPECGSPTAVTYENQRLYFVCTVCDGAFDLDDDHPTGVLSGWPTNPTALNGRAPDEIYSAVRTAIHHRFAEIIAGICPDCTGRVESSLRICDDHESETGTTCSTCGRNNKFMGSFVCTVCKQRSYVAPTSASLRHPAVIAFYWRHGIELGLDSHETARQFVRMHDEAEEKLISEDPPRVRVSINHDGDGIELLYDEAMQVIEVIEG